MHRSKSSNLSLASEATVLLDRRQEDDDDYRPVSIVKEKASYFVTTARMQHLLGISTLWVLLPAVIHMYRGGTEFLLVGLHFGVTIASVLYWRHYDQKSLSGHLDRVGAVLAMTGLALRAGRSAWLAAGALLAAIFFFYQLSVAFRAKDKPGPGLIAHVTFRFSAFWLSVLVLLGNGSFACAFSSSQYLFRVFLLSFLYATHSAIEFFFLATSYQHLISTKGPGAPPVLPWRIYAAGIVRTALLVSLSGYSIFLHSAFFPHVDCPPSH